MASRFEHLLILLPWLYRNNGVTIEAAAKEFDRTEKEFIEDLTLLTLVGVGQYAMEQFDVSWHDGRIYVKDHLGLDRAFRFDAMETACLLLGVELIEQLADAQPGFSEADVASLRQKLEAALPSRPVIHVVDDEETDQLVDAIARAISEGRKVQFVYDNVSRDDRTVRVVSPLALVAAAAEPSLQAWCHTSNAWRSFRLDRVSDLAVLDEASTLPESGFEAMPTQAVLIRVPTHRQELLERFQLLSEPQFVGDGVQAEVAIAQPQWLARQCQAAGGDISVISPDTVRTEVHALLTAAVSAYR